MGQDISTSLNPPLLSLQDFLVNGKFDLTRYLYYIHKIDMFNAGLLSHPLQSKIKFENESKIQKSAPPCSVKRYKLLVRNDDGSLREMTPQDTLWYLKYVKTPTWNDWLKNKFRSRFCKSIDKHLIFQR